MKTQELTREEKKMQEQVGQKGSVEGQMREVEQVHVAEQESVAEKEHVLAQVHVPTKDAPLPKKTVTLKEPEAKYVQQHLANERTFLAWIRTTVSIMGVGLITTSLHFELSSTFNTEADNLIKIVGYATLLLGVIMLAFSVISYQQKRKGINDGTFRSTSTFVIFMCVFMALIVFLFGIFLFKAY